MRYIIFTLLFLLSFTLLPGQEKWASPARITLLYKEVPGRLFSRVRPSSDIRLVIKKANQKELDLLQKGLFTSSHITLFLIPQKDLPSRPPEGALLFPYALTGKILALHPSHTLKDLPLPLAQRILRGEEGFREKIPGRLHSGRLTLYGTSEFLPSPGAGKKGPLLIPAATSQRAGELLILDPGGIGVFPLTFWDEKNLTLLSIDGISPTPENFMSGKYPLAEKLFLYAPPCREKEKELLHKLKVLLVSRAFHIELLYGGILPLPPQK